MFGKKYAIIQLDSIPREKNLLQATLLDARRTMKNSNLSRFAALNICGWACYIFFIWGPSLNAAPQIVFTELLYLPVIVGAP